MDIILFDGDGHKVTIFDSIPTHFQREKIIVVQGRDDEKNREAVSSKNVDILLDPHVGKRHDKLYQRDSGLNPVLCKLAKQNHVAIGFSFSAVLHAVDRTRLLGRMMQNIRLCQKYKVPMVIGSFASDIWDQRNEKDLQAFFRCLGMKDGFCCPKIGLEAAICQRTCDACAISLYCSLLSWNT